MTRARLAKILIEGPDQAKDDTGGDGEKPKIDKKIAVFLNRLLLRIFSVPALLTYLADVVLFQDDEAKDGQCKIQLDFMQLPDEIFPQVVKLCASPREPKLVRYIKNGSARTGVEMDVNPQDFEGDAIDYAFSP